MSTSVYELFFEPSPGASAAGWGGGDGPSIARDAWPFFDTVHSRSHLGGTCLCVQAMPEGLTPFYLELEDGVGGANFGGGNMQLDLESGVFDWAC